MGNLSEIFRICFSINSLITGIVTLGFITLITYFAFTLEKKINVTSPYLEKIIVNVSEMALLIIALLLVQRVFGSLTGGQMVELGGLYANAELTLLFYCLFVFNNRLIVLLNLALPFIYHPSFVMERLQGPEMPLFVISYLILFVVITFLYDHKGVLLVSNYKYLIAQVLFGICWWVIIWIDYNFPIPDIIGIFIVFELYMLVARIIEQKMTTYLHAYDDLNKKVNYDVLTGVRNRANFNKLSHEAFERHLNNLDRPVSLIMFDIDHFKKFNDHYGHEIGDEVLRHVAHIVERELHVDKSDSNLFRYGGEEFVILVNGVESEYCTTIINAINQTLKEMPLFIQDKQLSVTLCFGVTMFRVGDQSFAEALKRADNYLYESKNKGRNRMTIEGKTQNYTAQPIIHI